MKRLIFLLSLFIIPKAFAVKLYVVHLHRYYLSDTFPSHVQNNPVTNANQKIQKWFCQHKFENFHIKDNATLMRNGFPISSCSNTEIIPSKLGEFEQEKLGDEQFVVTGLYYTQCVFNAMKSLQDIFLKTEKNQEKKIAIHIPLDAIVFEHNLYATFSDMISQDIDSWRPWTENGAKELIAKTIKYNRFFHRNYNYEFFVDGKKVQANLAYYPQNRMAKVMLWTSAERLLAYLGQ